MDSRLRFGISGRGMGSIIIRSETLGLLCPGRCLESRAVAKTSISPIWDVMERARIPSSSALVMAASSQITKRADKINLLTTTSTSLRVALIFLPSPWRARRPSNGPGVRPPTLLSLATFTTRSIATSQAVSTFLSSLVRTQFLSRFTTHIRNGLCPLVSCPLSLLAKNLPSGPCQLEAE